MVKIQNKELNSVESNYLWFRIRNMIDMKIKGSSNGNKLDLKTLFSEILPFGKLPRMRHTEFWLIKDRKPTLAYMSSDKTVEEVKQFITVFHSMNNR